MLKMAKWDSKNLEIRSKSVEQTLVPLVSQVSKLSSRLRDAENRISSLTFSGNQCIIFCRYILL